MLQQILQDMWVAPEILAELDDDQKQTLFCRMREEQVRRWKEWDQQHEPPACTPPPRSRQVQKQVDFLMGVDGEPWVWVMGEHADDLSIDQILERETREHARRLAELETKHMRKKMEEELSELLDMNAQQIRALGEAQATIANEQEAVDIYCTVDELVSVPDHKPLVSLESMDMLGREREDLDTASVRKQSRVAQRVALWERHVTEERTSQIFRNLRDKKAEVDRESREAETRQELAWQEQERKAKEAEIQIREIARRAREEHRRTSVLDSSQQVPSSPTQSANTSVETSPSTPLSREAVVQWYLCSEVPRGAGICLDTHTVQPWFHGLITRQEAERILNDEPVGTFLVRVSEKIWGYAISYRDADRCKHYLVDASNGHYQFLGSNHLIHDSLADMVAYHRHNVITVASGELLLYPRQHVGTPAILEGVAFS